MQTLAFRQLKIKARLTLLIALLSLMLLCGGAIGWFGVGLIKDALENVYGHHLVAINQLNEIRNKQMQIRVRLLVARQRKDAFQIMEENDKVSRLVFQVQTMLDEYRARALSAEETRLLDDFVAARLNFGQTGVMPLIDMLQTEQFDKADTLMENTLEPAYEKASAAIDALLQYQVNTAKETYDRMAFYSRAIRVAIVVGIVGGLLLTLTVGFLLTRAIGRGVTILQRAARQLAEGDLRARANLDTQDELGDVARAFNTMAQEFAALIEQVRLSTEQLTGSSQVLSSISESVTRSSHDQTQQSGLATAATEELNAAVQQVAQSAALVVKAGTSVEAKSSQGQQVVGSAVQEIRGVSSTVQESTRLITSLGQRSHQIGKIVEVIREIAEQTNLLALNAAIEAARAGEQGRGFAVVADEVRKLAEKTASATAEISTMISGVQKDTANVVSSMERGTTQVLHGVNIANEAVSAIADVNAEIADVVKMIEQIADTIYSQSQATAQITAQMEHIAQAAQQNGASIEQVSDASRGLHELSNRLQTVMNRFTL